MDDKITRTQSGKSSKSVKSAKSGISSSSRTSIKVRLPTAEQSESPVQVRGYSPERRYSPDRHTPLAMTNRITPDRQSPKKIERHASPGKPFISEYQSTVVPSNSAADFRAAQSEAKYSSGSGKSQRSQAVVTRAEEREFVKIVAVGSIERAWCRYRDSQMFKLLKHAVCAAEHSLSYEILRKVCPKEADIVNDKVMKSKVRFRFGGTEFPPMIFFKIFTSAGKNGMGNKYISGKRMIQPASEAARDACDLMGNRKYYDMVIHDVLQYEKYGITTESDVTTLKDYMKYASLLDETPSYLGGRDNSWRKLTLEILPRHTIFYDVVEYLYSRKISTRLLNELPVLLAPPVTQDIQVAHIQIISQNRLVPYVPCITKAQKLLGISAQSSGRRSKKARSRVTKMKRMYRGSKGEDDSESIYGSSDIYEDDEWEKEARDLYEWTQELSFDDVISSPRLGPSASMMTANESLLLGQ